MNGFARGIWKGFDDVRPLRKVTETYQSQPVDSHLYEGWRKAVGQLIK